MTHLVPEADNIGIIMANKRGEGQGAYTPLVNVTAVALAVVTVAPLLPAKPRFDVDTALLGLVPTKSNIISTLHPSL